MTILEDKHLERDFKRSMANQRNKYPTFNVGNLPNPFKTPQLYEYVKLINVEDETIKSLESDYVRLIKSRNIERFIYDEDDNLKNKVKYKLNPDNVVISTEKDLGIRKSRDIKTRNYAFIDFKIKDGKKEYFYEVPKSVCYKVNLCYLIVSINKRKNNLGGEKIVLKNGHPVYLYVIPKRNSKLTEGYKVLAVKPSNNFAEEIKYLKNYWRQNNIMFADNDNFQIESLTKGDYNLISEIYETSIEVPKVESKSLDKGADIEW